MSRLRRRGFRVTAVDAEDLAMTAYERALEYAKWSGTEPDFCVFFFLVKYEREHAN